MDLLSEGHPAFAIALVGLITAVVSAEKFRSKFAGVLSGLLAFGFFTGLYWILVPGQS